MKKMNRKELAAHLRSIGVRLNYTACSLRESVDFPLPPKFILCAYMQVSCQGNKKALMRRVLEYIKTTELKTKSATTNSHSLPAAEAAAPNDSPPVISADTEMTASPVNTAEIVCNQVGGSSSAESARTTVSAAHAGGDCVQVHTQTHAGVVDTAQAKIIIPE